MKLNRKECLRWRPGPGDIKLYTNPAGEHRDFLDCIRSRKKPHADIEEGHRSTTMSLLSKISLAVQQRIEWDPETEQITNNQQANDMLHYEYRKPWTLG